MGGLRLIAAMALGLGVLAAWRIAYPLTCAALAAPALVYLVIAAGLRENGVAYRRFFASFYFKEGTFLRRWFTRTFFVTLFAGLAALIPAAALCLDLTTWSPYELGVLAVDAVVLLLILRLFDGMARGAAEPKIRGLLVKRWSVAVNTVLLLAALVAVRLMTPAPDYVDQSLPAMVENASAQFASACPWIDAALRLQIGKEALGWWLILWSEGRLAGGDAAYLRWLAWALFLVSGSLSAFGYSWFMAQLIYAADHVEDET